MAFVDPAADPEYIFYAYKRYNFVQKDPNFTSEEDLYKDVNTNQLNLLVRLKLQTQTMNVMV